MVAGLRSESPEPLEKGNSAEKVDEAVELV